ncbi:MBL fold metallo-hydrolase [Candidatus Bipolaricaulota bacterium]|nr:MBL fold metallo-hydrolase [Candidatus Bipolaricaulota bacterium]TFH11868.1 MAG: MBL fold metallo-hydrolase [Candidatus Atribacteria bacterium]
MRLLMYSKALYSTWIYYSADRILFDAGEGASSILGNKAFAIRHIFLSHGHADHISGLIGLVNIRNNAMGDKEKQLSVYYPKDNFLILEMMKYISRTNRRLDYQLEWIPVEPGDRIELLDCQMPRYVEAFPTVHVSNEVSLGYNVVEVRHRLKPSLAGLSQEEIVAKVRSQGRDAVSENYHQKLFSYGGDSVAIKPAYIADTEVLCHDTTFLDESDRKEYKHATLTEAIACARDARVKKHLYCVHISSRYKAQLRKIEAAGGQLDGLDFEVTLVPPGRITVVE